MVEKKDNNKSNKAVHITIVASRVFGMNDADESIYIPGHEIEKEIKSISVGTVNITEFKEYHCRGMKSPWSFPAVKKGNLYMIWITERDEWVGIEYEDRGSHYEGMIQGFDEDIYSAGPFKLNDECARLILKAYNNPSITIDEVLHTSPTKLKESISTKATRKTKKK